MNRFIDYYDLLGLSLNASEDLIKKAYRIASKKAHPDVVGLEADFWNGNTYFIERGI